MDISKQFPLTKLKLTANLGAFAFWITFALNYLYFNRLMIIASYDRFQLGVFVLGLSLLIILAYQKLVLNYLLILSIILFSGVIFISTFINDISWIQFLAFIRIPIIVYLIYNLVWFYLNTDIKVARVLRIMYAIAVFQLPVIVAQRFLYPYLPARLKFGSISGQLSLTDFGMGTFSGDTSMAFALIGLVILLLFDHRVRDIIKWRWFVAGWLSVTVLFSNSQVQHFTIAFVWILFFLSHMKIKNILIGSVILLFVVGITILLSRSNLMTNPLLQSSLNKITSFAQVFEGEMNYEKFLSGSHARVEAISYYLNQPIKWIGDGPGAVFDTASGRRTVGGWGQIFTFYAEVGLVGWILSVLVFFAIAFPIQLGHSSFKLQISWVQALIFLIINIVTFVKYPMGNSAIMFTYCVLLVSYFVLSRQRRFVKISPV